MQNSILVTKDNIEQVVSNLGSKVNIQFSDKNLIQALKDEMIKQKKYYTIHKI